MAVPVGGADRLGPVAICVCIITARRLSNTATRIADPLIWQLLGTICEQLKLSTAVRLHESSKVAVPLCVGWRMPCVVPAADWREWPEDTLRAVLAHELAHVARRCGMAATRSLSVHFVVAHPLAWLAAWRMRVERSGIATMQSSPPVRNQLPMRVHCSGFGRRLAATQCVPSVAVAMAAHSGLEQHVRAILAENRPLRLPVGRFARRGLAIMAAAVMLVTGALVPSRRNRAILASRHRDTAATAAPGPKPVPSNEFAKCLVVPECPRRRYNTARAHR